MQHAEPWGGKARSSPVSRKWAMTEPPPDGLLGYIHVSSPGRLDQWIQRGVGACRHVRFRCRQGMLGLRLGGEARVRARVRIGTGVWTGFIVGPPCDQAYPCSIENNPCHHS